MSSPPPTSPLEPSSVEVSIPVLLDLRALRRSDVRAGAMAADPEAQDAASGIAAQVTLVLSDIILALADKGIRLEGTIRICDQETVLG